MPLAVALIVSTPAVPNRLSNFWIPTGGITASEDAQNDAHSLLVRAGFVRQTHSGIFHLLPLGNRVQEKLERLIDKHMTGLGASKVSLSSISSEDLWRKSGRLQGHGSELFKLSDRKAVKLLLSPTHEEEITTLVANNVRSYKDLPVRLYQITRKYRDEQRPRQGLLRGREFLMKDLYTFDLTEQAARETYERTRKAYRAFLDELAVPYLVAKADTGAMGGDLSHEYHFISERGEDTVIACDNCDHAINEELAFTAIDTDSAETRSNQEFKTWFGISKDRRVLVEALYPRRTSQNVENEINAHAIRKAIPEIDIDLGVEDPLEVWLKSNAQAPSSKSQIIKLTDPRLSTTDPDLTSSTDSNSPDLSKDTSTGVPVHSLTPTISSSPISLTRIQPGDACPSCVTGKLQLHQAVEIGHTFHLGTRYSRPLELTVLDPTNKQTLVEMGCHGIGVSRLIAAIPSMLSDGKGLVWPAKIAPWNVVVVAGKGNEGDAEGICASLVGRGKGRNGGDGRNVEADAVLDDREKPMGWKLNDADLIGYPIIVVLGRKWNGERMVEVQCRRLGVKEDVKEEELVDRVEGYLARL